MLFVRLGSSPLVDFFGVAHTGKWEPTGVVLPYDVDHRSVGGTLVVRSQKKTQDCDSEVGENSMETLKEIAYVVPRAWGSWFVGGFLICALFSPGDPGQGVFFALISSLVVALEWEELAAQRLEDESHAT